MFYAHWRDAPVETWQWPNFSPEELACRGTGKLLIHEGSLDMLQELRTKLGKPLYINSAYRSPEYNEAIGGAAQSQHLVGRAFDVSLRNINPGVLCIRAERIGFTGFGEYSDFLHIDTGLARFWRG